MIHTGRRYELNISSISGFTCYTDKFRINIDKFENAITNTEPGSRAGTCTRAQTKTLIIKIERGNGQLTTRPDKRYIIRISLYFRGLKYLQARRTFETILNYVCRSDVVRARRCSSNNWMFSTNIKRIYRTENLSYRRYISV